MIKMLAKHKLPSLEAALVVILLVISMLSIGFHTEDKLTGMGVKDVTGNIVKVTGI